MDDIKLCEIKKDIFVAIISNGSTWQKEHWIDTAKEAFDFCINYKADKAVKAPVRSKVKKQIR